MSIMPSDEELRFIARRRVEDRIGFYIHLTIYVAVNFGLFLIWFFTGQGFPWFIIPMAFWGVGVAAHGFGVFAGQGYADRKVEEEYQRMKNQRS